MPTYDRTEEFRREYKRLTQQEKVLFTVAVGKFVADLRAGHFRPGLRVRGVQGKPNVYEMTWAPDGRAFFTYGDPVRESEPHVIWLRIGSHDIFE